jgi:D-alanyl-D-alanine carboxypeptidase/D-alanyl-D-alanine-endopeptidase (penicillin-binding protein 4)
MSAVHCHFRLLLALSLSLFLCRLAAAQGLPPAVEAALQRANLPADALTLLVLDVDPRQPPRLSHRADVPMNPASVMKLVTTFAALELLGPAYSWRTPVYLDGAVREGTLHGNLYLRGLGDPKLVVERLWLLLRRVQALGVRQIAGDIVLDRSAFDVGETDPANFDGEPLRPYNATADALLLNFKSVSMTFTPERSSNTALVQFEPPLAGVEMQSRVPLVAGECGDYRASLKADFSDPAKIRFAGAYPGNCAEKVWSVAYADPKSFALRAVEGLWREMGGRLLGAVREGRVPATTVNGSPAAGESPLEPTFDLNSAPLAEIIRDINKYSNNVMAQQLFLTLSLAAPSNAVNAVNAVSATSATSATPVGRASADASRAVLRRWWLERFEAKDLPLVDNGSGLSRRSRITAQALARLLQAAYSSPLMPDFVASLPLSGVDGTLKNRRAMVGSAHLKTGSLRDVSALAGYVHAASGRRYVMVAIANHPAAEAARPVFEALQQWTLQDQASKDPARSATKPQAAGAKKKPVLKS